MSMFRGRALKVTLAKADDEKTPPTAEEVQNTLINVSVTAQTIGREVAKIAATWIALDTGRKILINRLSK